MIIAAAVKEGYFHLLFIQGDHFQVKAPNSPRPTPRAPSRKSKDLIKAVPAGFWNIDIDTSTLVTLDPPHSTSSSSTTTCAPAEITQYIPR